LAVEAKGPFAKGPFAFRRFFQEVISPVSGSMVSGGRSLVIGGRWGLPPPALGLLEPVAVAVQFQDMDVVGETVEQRAGEAFGAEDGGPLLERQIGCDTSGDKF
jgi:hypothetical protein